MIGAAAESVILDLRNKTVHKVASLKRSIPKGMEDWKIKTVSDALRAFFEAKAPGFPRQLREPFEAYWAAFAQRIRATRNDAGHPASVESVTPDTPYTPLFSSFPSWQNSRMVLLAGSPRISPEECVAT